MRISTKTPIRLQDAVLAAFLKEYKISIEENGATFAANEVIAADLRAKGHKIPDLVKPKDRIRAGQKRRWRTVRKTEKEIEAKRAERNEARRNRRAERKKAAQKIEDNEIA